MKGRFVKTHYYLTAIIFIVFSNTILSQSDLRAFNIQQSPVLAGAGQIGVSIPTKDVLGFYFNPAILGYTSKENHAVSSAAVKKR
jgi:hypothetical protein